MMKQKCLFTIGAIVFFVVFLSGCASTGSPVRRSEPEKAPVSAGNIEERLGDYNFNVLSKIEDEQLPRYVLAVIGDATEIKEAKLDLGELIATEVNKSGRVQMVDRNNLDKIIEEQKLALQGITEESSIKLGELAGADYLIMSSIIAASHQREDKVVYEQLVVRVKVQLKLLDVSSGEVSLTLSGEGEKKTKLNVDASGKLVAGAIDYNNLYAEATLRAIEELIPRFISRFPLIGFMLKIGAEEVTCDLGSAGGITKNSVIAFIRMGKANYHPVTKKLVSIDYEYLGYGTVVEAKSTTSIVKIQETTKDIEATDLVIAID